MDVRCEWSQDGGVTRFDSYDAHVVRGGHRNQVALCEGQGVQRRAAGGTRSAAAKDKTQTGEANKKEGKKKNHVCRFEGLQRCKKGSNLATITISKINNMMKGGSRG